MIPAEHGLLVPPINTSAAAAKHTENEAVRICLLILVTLFKCCLTLLRFAAMPSRCKRSRGKLVNKLPIKLCGWPRYCLRCNSITLVRPPSAGLTPPCANISLPTGALISPHVNSSFCWRCRRSPSCASRCSLLRLPSRRPSWTQSTWPSVAVVFCKLFHIVGERWTHRVTLSLDFRSRLNSRFARPHSAVHFANS